MTTQYLYRAEYCESSRVDLQLLIIYTEFYVVKFLDSVE